MESSSVISPEDVLECLMNDGTIDAMRLKIINLLKANEELKNTTIKMAEQSKVLNTPGAEKQTKRELFDALRQELETSVLEKASKSVWELILDNNGLGKEISETVEKVFCKLSGREPPLFPPNVEPQLEKKKEEESQRSKGKEIENRKDNSVVFCKLSGHGPLLFRPNFEPQLEKKKEEESQRSKGKEIENRKDNSVVFCKLSGHGPPLFRPNVEPQLEKKKEKRAREAKGKR